MIIQAGIALKQPRNNAKAALDNKEIRQDEVNACLAALQLAMQICMVM